MRPTRHQCRLSLALTVIAIASCKRMALNQVMNQTEVQPEFGVENYVAECEKALGPVPDIDCRLVDENVVWTLDQTNTPKRVDVKDGPYTVKYSDSLECMNPSPVGQQRCHPYNRFGYLPVEASESKGTIWWAGCQRGGYAGNDDTLLFRSVSLIGVKDRKLCFFRSRDTEGGVSVGIDSPRKSPSLWHKPAEFDNKIAQNCVRCHLPNPYLRDTFMRHRDVAKALGVTKKNFSSVEEFDRYMTEPVQMHYRAPILDSQVPTLVAGEHLGSGRGDGLWVGTVSTEPVIAQCQSCHLLSGGFFNARYIPQLFGVCNLKDPYGDNHCKRVDRRLLEKIPDHHRAFFLTKISVRPESPNDEFEKQLADYFERCWASKDFDQTCRFRVLRSQTGETNLGSGTTETSKDPH
jgi:hypothetical protein